MYMGEFDWNALIKDVAGGWAAVEQANAAKDIAKMQAQAAIDAQNRITAYNPMYSPVYSPGGQMPGYPGYPQPQQDYTTLLLIGGAALLLVLLMR